MKQIVLFTVLIMSVLVAKGQITVTAETLPDIGDTLRTAVDGIPSDISITTPGGDQVWDFKGLQGVTREVVYLPASEGTFSADFPSANLVVISAVGETYYLNSGSSFELVGYKGQAPDPIMQEVTAKFTPRAVQRRAPMNFFDDNSMNTALTLAAAADDLPLGGVLDSLPITPDSLRLRIVTTRDDLVDAWGILSIPGNTYDVLREKRLEITETRMDVKIFGLPWQDFTDFLPDIDFLGMDTTKTYHFYSNEVKEPIAIATVDPQTNDVISVEYRSEDISTSVKYINKGRADLFAYPNPAIDEVRFDFVNVKSGIYQLKMFNILGKVVWQDSFPMVGDKTVKVDLSALRKGTYLYSLIDGRGKTVTTKRLMIIRP